MIKGRTKEDPLKMEDIKISYMSMNIYES